MGTIQGNEINKAQPLTRGHKILGFKWFAKCGARWQRFLSVDKFAGTQTPTFHTAKR
jgi:hypothetical protein